jgi:Fur family ferric uptake transcriptional regulator
MTESTTFDWANVLRQHGYRLTEPRQAVARVLAEAQDWLLPEAILRRARRFCPSLGLVTVYRTLELLEGLGYIRRVHQPDGCHGFARTDGRHGHYLVCRECQQVIEFADCRLDPMVRQVARRTGFQVEGHVLELVGLCPQCASRSAGKTGRRPQRRRGAA